MEIAPIAFPFVPFLKALLFAAVMEIARVPGAMATTWEKLLFTLLLLFSLLPGTKFSFKLIAMDVYLGNN